MTFVRSLTFLIKKKKKRKHREPGVGIHASIQEVAVRGLLVLGQPGLHRAISENQRGRVKDKNKTRQSKTPEFRVRSPRLTEFSPWAFTMS